MDICGGQLLIVALPSTGRAPAAPSGLDGTALPGEQGKVLVDRGSAQAGHPHELGDVGPGLGNSAQRFPEHVFQGAAVVTVRGVLGLVSDASDAALEKELAAEIATAVEEVEAMPPPARASLLEDVYAELPWHLREQQDTLHQTASAPTHG